MAASALLCHQVPQALARAATAAAPSRIQRLKLCCPARCADSEIQAIVGELCTAQDAKSIDVAARACANAVARVGWVPREGAARTDTLGQLVRPGWLRAAWGRAQGGVQHVACNPCLTLSADGSTSWPVLQACATAASSVQVSTQTDEGGSACASGYGFASAYAIAIANATANVSAGMVLRAAPPSRAGSALRQLRLG